jgi:PIN domain nuclease of toxin-antitoxin system
MTRSPTSSTTPTLFDAFAVVALLRGEPAADDLEPIVRAGAGRIHPVNLAEVVDRLARVGGVDPDEIVEDVALLDIETTDCLADTVVTAGALRARHYRRAASAISLGDCVAGAHALAADLPLATADPALATMVRAENGTVLALPDSSGNRP